MKRTAAFSLVELAIVLVILGLLVGGILAGQSLIRAANVRSVGRDITMLQTSMFAFRDKYMAMPGDFSQASKFWGCTDCDGNGDGSITNHAVDTQLATNRWEESLVMYHLAQAGLITGTYTGDYVAARGFAVADNAYPSKFNRAVFAITRPDVWGATSRLRGRTAICLGPTGRTLTCVGPQNSASNTYDLYAEDAWNIDTKLDDGSARNGKLLSDSCMIDSNRWGFDDVTIYRSTNADYEYDMTNRTFGCGLMLHF